MLTNRLFVKAAMTTSRTKGPGRALSTGTHFPPYGDYSDPGGPEEPNNDILDILSDLANWFEWYNQEETNKEKCPGWAIKQERKGINWTHDIPDCPCSLNTCPDDATPHPTPIRRHGGTPNQQTSIIIPARHGARDRKAWAGSQGSSAAITKTELLSPAARPQEHQARCLQED